jgi:hypothetical protein
VTIADPSWAVRHRSKLLESLGQAPYFSQALEVFEAALDPAESNLSTQNVALIRSVCSYLGITTPLTLSRDLQLTGSKTDRLLDLLRKTGATTYISGPNAKSYLEEERFAEQGITLEYKAYDYEPYSQLFGPFVGEVTVLDLIANEGPRARQLCRTRVVDAPATE